jgi:nucleoid-associated protein YgaU
VPGLPEPAKAEAKLPSVPGLPEPAKIDAKLPPVTGAPEPAKLDPKAAAIPGLTTQAQTDVKPQMPATAANAALPPITTGNSNNANTPNFVIPSAKPGDPKVVNYDSKQYMAQPGDTFASLAKAAYGDERFANALLAYNRDFSSNRTMTAPQPGQLILLPPPQVLQQSRYASAAADARTPIGAAPVSISPPVPAIPARTFTPATPTSDVTKSYRIPPSGQLIYELAVQTLGDGARWAEIYRLNPMVDPLRPIPGNTVVRLPASANVP